MNALRKLLLIELCIFIIFPVVGIFLTVVFEWFGLHLVGEVLFAFLVALWCWELFASIHYRYCRQEEFLYLLQTAGSTQAPLESVLRAYLDDRPREILYRSFLLFFVFPGYFWIHYWRGFDARLGRLVNLLESGVPFSYALKLVPWIVSRETALAVTVGEFSGDLPRSLARIPDRRLAPQWLEMATRLMYPFVVLGIFSSTVSFLVIFIIPKFEKIFLEFKMKLPVETQVFVAVSRGSSSFTMFLPLLFLLFLAFFNLLAFSSRAKWHFPIIGWFYRMHARGQFLQTLGLMLETGKPLGHIIDSVLDSGLLPTAVFRRVDLLALDLYDGRPLDESLVRRGLVTASMKPLVQSAQKADNLAWALQELGDSLQRRSARIAYRTAMVVFPLTIVAISVLVGMVAISLFTPLVTLIEGVK